MSSSGTKAALYSVFATLVATVGLVAVPLPAAQAAPPSNDAFADAQVLNGPGIVTGTNVDATSEAGEPDRVTDDAGTYAPGTSVWYRWTSPNSPTQPEMQVWTRGSDFDTVLGVYTGGPGVAGLTQVGANDDYGVASGPSRVQWQPAQNTTYYISVDGCCGAFGSEGSIRLRLSEALDEGSIEGYVTSNGTTGIPDICAVAVDDSGEPISNPGYTDASGWYVINGVAAGSNRHVQFSNCGATTYAGEFNGDAQTVDAATDVQVLAGLTTEDVNAVLAEGGSISGTIAANPGVTGSLSDVCVRATMVGAPDDGFTRSTLTDSSGDYLIEGLDGGQYRLRFGGDCGPNYNTFGVEYWDDAAEIADADLVSVTEGLEAENYDAGLGAAPGAISGTVREWESGPGIEDICVRAVGPSYTSPSYDTDANGDYLIPNVPAGTNHIVRFSDCHTSTNPLATQWYNRALYVEDAEPITVNVGTTTPDIDASMFHAATLSGQLTDANGNGRSPACAEAHVADVVAPIHSTETTEAGNWSILVPPGTYELEFRNCGTGGLSFETRWYHDSTDQAGAQEIPVDQGDVEDNLDQEAPGVAGTDGRITGVVTDNLLPAAPLEGICIRAVGGFSEYEATTDAQGEYLLQLPPGSYTIDYWQCDSDYPYNVRLHTKNNVTVLPGSITAGTNAEMQPGGGIAGLVTNEDGTLPLKGICVTAYTDPDASGQGWEDFTNADGEFRIVGLPASADYFVTYEDCTYEYLGEWYEDVPFMSPIDIQPDGDPTDIPVTVGSDTAIDPAGLERMGTISGTVTNEAGDPLEEICVFAENPDGDFQAPWYAFTDADGHYMVGGLQTTTNLADNGYRIRFSQCTSTSPYPEDYGDEYWDNRLTFETADPIAVVYGDDTGDINAVLQSEAPVIFNPPTILGQASVGMTLQATNGDWEHDPSEYAFQWYRCDADGVTDCEPVDSDGRQYLITEEDLGSTMRVDVTATNSVGDDTASSDPSSVIDDAPPYNDDIQDRLVFGASPSIDWFGSNVGATRQAGEPAHAGFTESKSVWFEWTAPSGGAAMDAVSIDVPGTATYAPTISVYTGTPVPLTGLTLVTEDAGAGMGFDSSRVVFEPVPGTTYYVAVDGYWDGSEISSGPIDLQLSPASGVSGTVTDDEGDPVRDICVAADATDGSGDYYEAYSDADGTYLIEAPAGEYVVSFTDCIGEYADQWYDDASVVEDADPVTVPEDEVVPDVDAQLVQVADFGTISGTVTNEAGDPLPFMCVVAFPTEGGIPGFGETDSNGSYLVRGLGDPDNPTDEFEYYLTFMDCSGFYGSENWDNKVGSQEPDSIMVSALNDLTGYDAVLQHEAPVNTDPPRVVGAATIGATLTIDNGVWQHEPGLFEYQWMRCNASGGSCVPISGAESSSYVTTNSDSGAKIRVDVTATNSIGSATILSYSNGLVIGAPGNTQLPAVTGGATIGATLSVNTGSWSGDPTSYAYQWMRCNAAGGSCVAIAGAQATTYVTTNDDSGSKIRVNVTATNAVGSTTALSLSNGLVIGAPGNTQLPVISGPPTVGANLSVNTGTWSGSPTSYSYQWLRCSASGANCVPISGAQSSGYVTTNDDLGMKVRVHVTAVNAIGSTTALTNSNGVISAPLAIGTPEVMINPVATGSGVVGATLTIDTGSWSGSPSSFTYQWMRCDAAGGNCTTINGAQATTYVTTADDRGSRIRVNVTATNGVGSNTTLSFSNGLVIGAPTNSQVPMVTGTAAPGMTLSVTTGTWVGDPVSYTYQWVRCEATGGNCAPLVGSVATTYVTTNADSGTKIRVYVTATNSAGSNTVLSYSNGVIS